MANIKVTIDYPISDGTKLKFRTPCESTEVEGLVVKYPIQDGVGSALKTFRFVDAHGTELSGIGNVFTSDVMIEILLDVTKGRAFIQNADTNSYIEDIKVTVKRMDEERRTIFAEAGKSIKECNDATKDAKVAADTLNLSAEELRSSGFVESLKELNEGKRFTFWVGTQEEYNQITEKEINCFYLITDDSSTKLKFDQIDAELEGISKTTGQHSNDIEELKQWAEGVPVNDLKGVTLYEGERASTVTIPYIDYRDFTRFVAYAKGETTEQRITFSIIEDKLIEGSVADGQYSLVAYATKYIPGKDTDEIETFKLVIEEDPLNIEATATFEVIYSGADGFGGEAFFPYKLVGYKY